MFHASWRSSVIKQLIHIAEQIAKGIGLHNISNNVWIIEYIARVGHKG